MSAAVTKPVEVKNPTPDQRVHIRGHLDQSFDDAAGMYLDDMSDQRIAGLVGVPRIVVERMRGAAYGPIRVDPEIAALRAEIAQVKRDAETQQKALDTIKAKAAELGSRVERAMASRAA